MPLNNETDYCYVRFLNAIPNSPAVDIYMNGILMSENVEYSGYTNFMTLKSDTYLFEAIPSNNSNNTAILSIKVYLFKNSYYTIAIIGHTSSPDLELIADRPHTESAKYGLSYIRFVNLSPNSESCNIEIDFVPLFYHLYFMEVSNYLPIALKNPATTADVDGQTYTLSGISFEMEKYYTVYILGFSKNLTPGISLVTLMEGRGNFTFQT